MLAVRDMLQPSSMGQGQTQRGGLKHEHRYVAWYTASGHATATWEGSETILRTCFSLRRMSKGKGVSVAPGKLGEEAKGS